MRQPPFLLTLLFTLALFTSASAQNPMTITNPRVEYQSGNPAIDSQHPRFSWELTGEGKNRAQSAYRIELHGESGKTWDSGKVRSSATNQIVLRRPRPGR